MKPQVASHWRTDQSLKIEGGLPGTPHLLRRMNQIQVLSALRLDGPLTRTEIAEKTGLSKVTVNEVVSDLVKADLADEELESPDRQPSRPGPRARMVSFRHDSRYVIGMDIGATKALLFLADLSGRRIKERRLSTHDANSREDLLQLLRDEINDAVAEAGLSINDIVAMGVGTPGVVDPTTGEIDLAPQLPGWEGFSLADELSLSESCPVMVANEVQLAVLGEQWQGVARGVDNAAFVHIGVGVGLGIIMGGSLHRGATGAAGEIGYLPLGSDDPKRPPETGRFEWLVGGSAYARKAADLVAQGGGARLLKRAGKDSIDAEIVFRAAAEGDKEAAEIIDELTDMTAEGIGALVTVLDPELVIIGGGVSKAGDPLLDAISEKVSRLVPHAPRFAISALGDQAVAVGALRIAMERWENDMLALRQ